MKKLQIIEARAKPIANPAEPAAGARKTFVVTFDWGEDATAGMLDALRENGFWAVTKDRYPRTTILVRVSDKVETQVVLDVVAANLLDKGSAIVAQKGGSIHVWPDAPWEKGKSKQWRFVTS